jgi:AraC-like DNA-binding protein
MNGLVLPNVKSADVKATCDLIQCIAEQSDAPSPAIRSRLGEQLLNLMDVVLTDLSAPSRSRSSESLIFRAKRFMERNLENEDLDVSMVASAMHVSAKHLHRLFQAENLSVMRYLWTVRLERAACLLRTRGAHAMSAQEVAYRCGFSSASHFSRAFKDRFRKTPKEYRHIDI